MKYILFQQNVFSEKFYRRDRLYSCKKYGIKSQASTVKYYLFSLIRELAAYLNFYGHITTLSNQVLTGAYRHVPLLFCNLNVIDLMPTDALISS